MIKTFTLEMTESQAAAIADLVDRAFDNGLLDYTSVAGMENVMLLAAVLTNMKNAVEKNVNQ